MQRGPSSFRYVNSCPAHIQSIYSSAHICFNFRWNVSALLLEISRQLNARYPETWCQIQRTSTSLRHVICGRGHILSIYSSACSGFNIHCSYLRCYCRYHINSMRVILQTWCQIQRTPSSFRYVNRGPGHIQCNYSSS
jgi:hypothetical protein